MPTQLNLPVVEAIRQDLLDTVGQIAVVSGYNIDAVAYGATRLGNPINDGQQVVIDVILGESEMRDLLCNNVVEWVQEFLFVAVNNQPEDAESPPDELIAIIVADITKAVRKDITRSGLAHDTLQKPPEWFTRSSGQHEGVTAKCWVLFRVDINDPYTDR